MNKINVVLADDHTILRKGLKALLGRVSDIEVVGEARTGTEVVTQVEDHVPDIVVMDIGMPELNGIEATKRILKMYPDTRILILTVHSNEEYIYQIFSAGAKGYLLKDSAPDELLTAIRAVLRNEKYLSPKLSSIVIDEYINPRQKIRDPLDDLTEREREVLQLIGVGYKIKEIAEKLYISRKTVETHRTNLGKKLGLQTQAELIKFAVRRGIVVLE